MKHALFVRSVFILITILSWGSFRALAAPGETDRGGVVCVAGFKPPTEDNLPNMSPDTWGPSATSVFAFQAGKRAPVLVHVNETVSIKDVPNDRRVLVRVKLDGRPFESFWLNLRKEPAQRICLWLYPGYWHWISTGWNTKQGCTCK